MSAVPEVITAHAMVLQSDAHALAECAERLRKIEAKLEEAGAAPPWLRQSVRAHLAACAAASADLAEASAWLRRYAAITQPGVRHAPH
ncbi:hypothetical protein AB0B45_30560 [Nonomuraea sp. NPDC049152]|uniref:hypothetical protein n=1 Tax=Nonomuraea sp. NPDC049152 TaxID=3154350 RepID=UPI00340DFCB6